MKLHLTLAALIALSFSAPVMAKTSAAVDTSATSAGTSMGTSAATTTTAPRSGKPALPAGTMLDINSASAQELMALPGVGQVRAEKIVAGRPYKGKDDLVSKKILPKTVYDKVKDNIIAKQK